MAADLASVLKTQQHLHNSLERHVHLSKRPIWPPVFMYDLQEMALYTLHEGEFIKNSIRIDELLDNIHPTDRKKYYDEYYNFIDGKIDIITLRIRFFDKDKDKYLYYEYIVKPLIKDYNNKVTRFIYSRKDETSKLEKIETQAELIQSLNLALRSSKSARSAHN